MTYLIGLIAAVIIFSLFKEYKERKEARQSVDQYFAFADAQQDSEATVGNPAMAAGDQAPGENPGNEIPDTLHLMKNALAELGCQPEVNNDGTMNVAYQGENFHLEFGGPYARIWDPFWSHIKEDDPEWPKVCQAINSANFNFGPTVVYTAPNDEGLIGLHSRRDILFHPSLPDKSGYIRSVLDSFFAAKDNVRNSFQRLNMPQQQSTEGRRPVGFSAAQEE